MALMLGADACSSDLVQCALLRNEGIVYDVSDDNKNGLIADERINSSFLGNCHGRGCLTPEEAAKKLALYVLCRCDDLQSVEPALQRMRINAIGNSDGRDFLNRLLIPVIDCNPEARKYLAPVK